MATEVRFSFRSVDCSPKAPLSSNPMDALVQVFSAVQQNKVIQAERDSIKIEKDSIKTERAVIAARIAERNAQIAKLRAELAIGNAAGAGAAPVPANAVKV